MASTELATTTDSKVAALSPIERLEFERLMYDLARVAESYTKAPPAKHPLLLP